MKPCESFDLDLERLKDRVMVLGSEVEDAMVDLVETLKERDTRTARCIIDEDRLINESRFELEADALTLMATQGPMAGDVRTIAAVLDTTPELERIGDCG